MKVRALSSSLTSSSATNHPRAGKVLSALMKMEILPRGKRSNASDKERERESALCGGLCPRSERFSRFLLKSVLSFLSLSQRNENNFVSLSLSSLFCSEKREHEREREKGDCDGIPPWCWKSGFDEDEDEDFVGDETKERRGGGDGDFDDDDAPSFVVFALVFVRSRDSTDG